MTDRRIGSDHGGVWKGEPLTKNAQVDRCAHELVIGVSTRRPGDVVHMVLAPLGLALGGAMLLVGRWRGRRLPWWITAGSSVAASAYGWFALTRAVNERTLTVDSNGLSVTDGPFPSLAPRVHVPLAEVGEVRCRSSERLSVSTASRAPVHDVEASGVGPPLFKALADEAEANRIRAALVAFLA